MPSKQKVQASAFEKLLIDQEFHIPQPGDLVKGIVLSASKSEVLLDIDGLTTGIVRGHELEDESGVYSHLKVGEEAEATVIDIENEKGIMELSFRSAGHKKAWENLKEMMSDGKVVDARIKEANKGGLLVTIGRVNGFLPVSQLTIEHYPRVEGGNKQRILERLQTYIDQLFKVKIIDVNETEEKLIVSEKAAWEDQQAEAISKYQVGSVVEGEVSGVVDFGAFVKFGDGLEGLVHISELAWQRIDDPRDIVKVGDHVQAEIIGLDRSKISLSMKKLIMDPWKKAAEKYTIGQTVKGKVLKTNPFGIFVELDSEIHGLAHISELSHKKLNNPRDVVEIGKEYDFKIISMDTNNHRLGLSIKALTEAPKEKDKEEAKPNTGGEKKGESEKKETQTPKTEKENIPAETTEKSATVSPEPKA